MSRNNRKTKPPMPVGPVADDHNLDKSVVPHKPGMGEPVETEEPTEPAEPIEPTEPTVPEAETEPAKEETEPETTEPVDK